MSNTDPADRGWWYRAIVWYGKSFEPLPDVEPESESGASWLAELEDWLAVQRLE